jgi:hypothetical protein
MEDGTSDPRIPDNSASKVQFKVKLIALVEAGIDFDTDFFLESPDYFGLCGSSSEENEDSD